MQLHLRKKNITDAITKESKIGRYKKTKKTNKKTLGVKGPNQNAKIVKYLIARAQNQQQNPKRSKKTKGLIANGF
jgi:hypothetical protein